MVATASTGAADSSITDRTHRCPRERGRHRFDSLGPLRGTHARYHGAREKTEVLSRIAIESVIVKKAISSGGTGEADLLTA